MKPKPIYKKSLKKINVNVRVQSSVLNYQIPIISSSINKNFKLPRLNTEQFNGKFKKWMSIKDLYNSLVHNNDSINNIQKFQYL